MSGPETGDTEDWQEKEQGLQDETGNDLSNKYNNNPKSKKISLFSTLFFIQTGCCLMVCRSGEYSCWKQMKSNFWDGLSWKVDLQT